MQIKIHYLVLYIIIVSYLSYIAITSNDIKYLKYLKRHSIPLPDIGHAYLPNLSKYENIIEAICFLPFLYLLYLSLKEERYSVIKEFSFIFCCLTLIRTITYSVTILPSIYCYKDESINTLGGCTDCIFSGHTSFVILSCLFLCHFKYSKYILLFPIIPSLLIISARLHYTVDVILSWLITIPIYLCYRYRSIEKFVDDN